MEHKYYDVAGLQLHLVSDFPLKDTEVTAPFLTQPQEGALLCQLRAVDALTPPQGEICLREEQMTVYRRENTIYRSFWVRGRDQRMCMLSRITAGEPVEIQVLRSDLSWCSRMGYVFLVMGLGTLLLEREKLVLHASVVKTKRGAILFTAASGTGKSTQAGLWQTHMGAEIINGDRCAVGFRHGIPRAFGVPMAGTSGISKNEEMPLVAIVALGQAPENQLRRLRGAEALLTVGFCSVIDRWEELASQKAMEILGAVMEQVPVFSLRCVPDKSAVDILAEALEAME